MQGPLTLREIGEQVKDAFRHIPKEKREVTFRQMMALLKTPVGRLPKVSAK